VFSRRLLLLPAFSALAVGLLVAHSATAQSASGSVTGRVVWGPCIRGIPLPMMPDGQAPAPGEDLTQPQPARPIPETGLPAGAVLVAVQNTSISARTDEAGHFTLSGVPAGQYMTVAAGPVANSVVATAARPNVFVNGGESVDLGTLNLGGGGPSPLGIPCRLIPGAGAAPGAEATAPDATPTSP